MPKTSTLNLSNNLALFQYGESLGHGELHVKMDQASGLRAIVAIHNTNLGPALGGCRLYDYDTTEGAIFDAMRLARGMSYKAAISNLALGGGKSVIIKPKGDFDRVALFEAFGKFINELGGRYITAVDSGSTIDDMDIVQRYTSYVATTSSHSEGGGDPSYSTALGVFQGIRAAVKLKLNRCDLTGLHVVIQGTGHVGYPLARHLHEAGARLTVCDISLASTQRCVDEFGATVVAPDAIFDVQGDVFAPCAMGAVLDDQTIAQLSTKIIAGSANNQLAEARHGKVLMQKGVLYVPDYVINAGGLIEAAAIYQNDHPEQVRQKVLAIYDAVHEITEQALATHTDPAEVADAIAAARIYATSPLTAAAA